MENKKFSLEGILYPITVKEFKDDFFEKKPLHIKGSDAARFDHLLTIGMVSSFLERGDLRLSCMRLIKDGMDLPTSFYTKSAKIKEVHYNDFIDHEKIFKLFSDGATISLAGLHQSMPSLHRLCSHMQAESGQTPQVNAYLTPAFSKALKPHYDVHDVFVLQVYGSKIWRLYSDPVEFAYKPHEGILNTKSMTFREITLDQGDLLYIPRGYVHDAYTTECSSLHATLGLLPTTWGELIGYLVESSQYDLEFRKPLHLERLTDDEIHKQLKQLAGLLISKVSAAGIRKEFEQRVLKKALRSNHNRLEDLLRLPDLNAETVFQVRQPVIFEIQVLNNITKLMVGDKEIPIRAVDMPVLEMMIERNVFKLNDLSLAVSSEEKLTLAKTLLKQGFLTTTDPEIE